MVSVKERATRLPPLVLRVAPDWSFGAEGGDVGRTLHLVLLRGVVSSGME